MGRLVFDVDDSVHIAFKIYCMKNGSSMTNAISAFMKRAVDGKEVIVPEIDGFEPKKGAFDVDGYRKALGLKKEMTWKDLGFKEDKKDTSIPPFLRPKKKYVVVDGKKLVDDLDE